MSTTLQTRFTDGFNFNTESKLKNGDKVYYFDLDEETNSPRLRVGTLISVVVRMEYILIEDCGDTGSHILMPTSECKIIDPFNFVIALPLAGIFMDKESAMKSIQVQEEVLIQTAKQ